MKKVLSFLLVLTLLLGVLGNAGLSLIAEAIDIPDAGVADKNSLVLNKTAKANDDGTFTITLEAYATGSKVTSVVKKDIPTDIILVLDQSGSMEDAFSSTTTDSWTSLGKRSNERNYNNANPGGYGSANLWYKLDDGSYVSVSVTRTRVESTNTYNEATSVKNSQVYNSSRTTYYAKDGDNYYQVSVTRSGYGNNRTYTYTYRNASGTSVTESSSGDNGNPPFTLYTRQNNYGNEYQYEYSYTVNGQKTVIGTSTGNNTTFDKEFYQKGTSTSSTSKLSALKSAVKDFVDSVNEKAKGADGEYGTDDDINHRIAVVGFATGDYSSHTDYPIYENTELFIGANEYNYSETSLSSDKKTLASAKYSSAFQDMNTQAGYDNVIASKDALAAKGATRVDLGIEMANGIFNANPISKDEERNRVMIVFTDGAPSMWDTYSSDVANSGVEKAYTTKNTHKATVYTVGIFEGANGTPVTTDDAWRSLSNANKFMHLVSSNFKSAEDMNEARADNTYPTDDSSYYLSASDSDSLANIFKQIDDNITSGGSSTTLDGDTVIKDIIAPQFKLPEGATAEDITLQTATCTGIGSDNEYTWSNPTTATGVTATINDDKVDVTGFNFSENWVGTETNNGNTTYRGSKLIISFKVEVKDGFLGGNDVFTNTSAGVYENANATEPVQSFNRPQVNVPIKDVTVKATDKNVYLLGSLTAEQIKAGATAQCGNVELKLNETNYGLEEWQYEHVNITTTYTDKDGNTISDLSQLKDDTTYTVSVTVAPETETPKSTEGQVATTQTGNGEGKINVFKPTLTYKDSTVYYGDTAPTSYEGNLTNTQWKHGDTVANPDTMTGTAPELTKTYTPGTGISDGKVNTKSDIPVDVTVKIGSTDVTGNTTFVHTKCDTSESDPTNGKFWLHVKTCSLTIEKKAATGTTIGDDEYFVFTINKDGKAYTQVTIKGTDSVTIKELPVGTYTVEEDASTAWRYSEKNITGSGNLSSTNPNGSFTCTNGNRNDKWLNYFAQVINTFGVDPNKK